MTMTVASLRQVTELLILLSRVEFTESEKIMAEELTGTINDWQLFISLSIRHGVAALVCQNIKDLKLSHYLPEKGMQALETVRLQAISRVTYITAAAVGLASELERHKIRVLFLKGLALEHALYGSRGLRQMSDADLLVSVNDVLRARDIIISQGYTSRPMKSSLYRHILLDIGNHLPEMHKGGISVDLHYRLFGPLATDITARAMDEYKEISAGGRTCYILPPEIAFLSMVSHLRKHEDQGEFQLRLYCDIYLLLKNNQSEILTGDLFEKAREAGVEDKAREILFIMKSIYKAELPYSYINVADGDHVLGKFQASLENPHVTSAISRREKYLSTIRSLPGLRSRIIFIIGDLFPSISFMKKRYNCKTTFGCLLRYPHRFGKLVWVLRTLF